MGHLPLKASKKHERGPNMVGTGYLGEADVEFQIWSVLRSFGCKFGRDWLTEGIWVKTEMYQVIGYVWATQGKGLTFEICILSNLYVIKFSDFSHVFLLGGYLRDPSAILSGKCYNMQCFCFSPFPILPLQWSVPQEHNSWISALEEDFTAPAEKLLTFSLTHISGIIREISDVLCPWQWCSKKPHFKLP